MMPLATLCFLLAAGFTQFLSELKRKPPCAALEAGITIHRPPIWSEHYGPRLIDERVIQLAPGIAVITGQVVEIGPPFGLLRRPVRILAVLHHHAWSVHHAECGPGPSPFVITRLTQ